MLVRPLAAGFAVYLTRRSNRSRFMPGAFVFPGGAVDESDRTYARIAKIDPPAPGVAPALIVAALRELFEEAGILLARDARGAPIAADADDLGALRAELARGDPFDALLARHGFELDAAALAYYSNWITPESEPIRFDAHFFIARAPADQTAAADAVEVHDGIWLRAVDALAAADRGNMSVRFPTRKHLERLARFDDIDALLRHARERTVAPVAPSERADGTLDFDEDAW